VATVLIAFGSNVGDRALNIRQALDLLTARSMITRTSSLYETEPMYLENQPRFLNGALVAETNLSPRTLLALLKSIEAEVGRQNRQVNGPREIDLDLIAYGSIRYVFGDEETITLEIPHPRAPERRFVMAPLAEIASDFLLPGLGTVRILLNQTEDQANSVTLYDHAPLSLSRT
jgi:2-amino-4-hydroxy-6-hydroxymethyldihydropteridine diphosphokinase